MSRTKKVGFVGAGNMAGALIRGVLEARLYRAGELWVTDPLPAQRRRIRIDQLAPIFREDAETPGFLLLSIDLLLHFDYAIDHVCDAECGPVPVPQERLHFIDVERT